MATDMTGSPTPSEQTTQAEMVLHADEVQSLARWFEDTLDFELLALIPADDPRIARLSGHGLTLRLDRHAQASPGQIQLTNPQWTQPRQLTAPNGTIIHCSAPEHMDLQRLKVAAFEPILTGFEGGRHFVHGRAGMRYRDLIPSRLADQVIASHIRIVEAGPVDDRVHHHQIGVQLIVCLAGWVRVVYEHQGKPFTLHPGDAVLQPPGIRHRVLSASAGLDVLEVGTPAIHWTHFDPQTELPSESVDASRTWADQRFIHFQSALANWQEMPQTAYQHAETGISEASAGLAQLTLIRQVVHHQEDLVLIAPDDALTLVYAAAGSAYVSIDDQAAQGWGMHDACTLAPGSTLRLTPDPDQMLSVYQVTLKTAVDP